MHPTTWLREGRWDDELPAEVTAHRPAVGSRDWLPESKEEFEREIMQNEMMRNRTLQYVPHLWHYVIKKGWIDERPKPTTPTDEFLQHHTVEKVETAKAGKKRTRVTDQLWIDYYLKHRHIQPHQHITAEQLLALYRAAGQAQKVTGSLDALPTGNAAQSDRSADALMDFFG